MNDRIRLRELKEAWKAQEEQYTALMELYVDLPPGASMPPTYWGDVARVLLLMEKAGAEFLNYLATMSAKELT